MNLKWWPTTLWHNHPARSCLIVTHTFWPLTTPRAWQEERWVSEESKEQSKHVKGQAWHTHSSINKIHAVSKKKNSSYFFAICTIMLWIWKFEAMLSEAIMTFSITDRSCWCTAPNSSSFFSEISVHWKHCAFAIFLSSASIRISWHYRDMSFSHLLF